MNLVPHLSGTFLKIFLRDRQALFFSLFFPVVFMLVFGFLNDGEPEPVRIGVLNQQEGGLQAALTGNLGGNPLLELREGGETALREALVAGELDLVLLPPPSLAEAGRPVELRVLVDAAQARQLALILPTLEQALMSVERELRGVEPLFRVAVEDVQARSQRYIDFLVPGLLAFSLMQLSVAGSGYNIVEFRRKGILKRLFVTPLRPRDFILALVGSRTLICLAQLALLLGIAVLHLGVPVAGDWLSLLLAILLGVAIFLNLGFCLGSYAHSQQTVIALGNLVIFPQIFLAGVFFPIDSLPALLQPVAALLPLSFVVDALRAIIIDGTPLPAQPLTLAGLLAWLALSLLLAVRLFRWKDVAA